MELQGNPKISGITVSGFREQALAVFRFQARHCVVYRDYLYALRIQPEAVQDITQIPFLPIRFFKSHAVITGQFEPKAVFESSGTTGMVNSRHFIKDIDLYAESFLAGFRLFYGDPAQYCILGLLPSYIERGDKSSLIYMVNRLMEESGYPGNGFYLKEEAKLAAQLESLEKGKQKTLLFGVAFALLDFAEHFPMQLQHTTLIETGGMKGRREELVRAELHERLTTALGVSSIHSEYGMTELLSQAWSAREGVYHCPPWMRILVREEEDPFSVKTTGAGALNIIDLANYWSCSFIATDDAGKIAPDGSFEVRGRIDGSDIRGCSLLLVE